MTRPYIHDQLEKLASQVLALYERLDLQIGSGDLTLEALNDEIAAINNSLGQANGIATLGPDGKLTPAQLPEIQSMEMHGNEWHTETYVTQAAIDSSLATYSARGDNPTGVTKAQVGLDLVGNYLQEPYRNLGLNAKSATDTPDTYPEGITYFLADSTKGFPFSSYTGVLTYNLYSTRTAAYQLAFDYVNGKKPTIKTRSATLNDTAWGNWETFETSGNKGVASGYAALDSAIRLIGLGEVLNGTVSRQVLIGPTFTNAGDKFDVYFSTNVSGYIEITLSSTTNNNNGGGKITKRINIVTSGTGTIGYQVSQYTDASGYTPAAYAISDISYDATAAKYKFYVEALVANNNTLTVEIKTGLGGTGLTPPTYSLSSVYTGSVTLTKPVQTIADDAVTQSGYGIQKAKITENDGTAKGGLYNGSLNALTDTGFYGISTGATNTPMTATAVLIVTKRNTSFISQLYMTTTSTSTVADRMFFRSTSDGGTTWRGWLEIAKLDSPAFTGTVTAPTVDVSDNSTNIATTAYVNSRVNQSTYTRVKWANQLMDSTSDIAIGASSSGANFMVALFVRVITAATTLTVKLSYDDGSGTSSTDYILNARLMPVGSTRITPVYFYAASGTNVTVTATAGTASQVYISCSIIQV